MRNSHDKNLNPSLLQSFVAFFQPTSRQVSDDNDIEMSERDCPQIWKSKIVRDFGLSDKVLSSAIVKLNQKPNFYETLYARLGSIKSKYDSLPNYTKYAFSNKANESIVIACCVDGYQALSVIPDEEYAMWLPLVMVAGCDTLALEMINGRSNVESYCRELAVHYASSALLERLTGVPGLKNKLQLENDQLRHFDDVFGMKNTRIEDVLDVERIQFDEESLYEYIRHGQVKTVEYVLTHRDQIHFTLDWKMILFNAQLTPHVDMIKYLFDVVLKENAHYEKETGMLSFAVHPKHLSDLDMMKFLYDPSVRRLVVTQQLLFHAADQGNIDVIRYLLDPQNQFNVVGYDSHASLWFDHDDLNQEVDVLTENLSITMNLLWSDKCFYQGMLGLTDQRVISNYDRDKLDEIIVENMFAALKYSPLHFCDKIEYALLKQSLGDHANTLLLDVLKKSIDKYLSSIFCVTTQEKLIQVAKKCFEYHQKHEFLALVDSVVNIRKTKMENIEEGCVAQRLSLSLS